MSKKLSILEKKVLADLLRYLMHESEQNEDTKKRIGRLSLLSPEFYHEITKSIAEKLDLPLSEFLPATEERREEVDND